MAGPQNVLLARAEANKVAAILNKAAVLLKEIDPDGASIALEVAGYFDHASLIQVSPREGPGPPHPTPMPPRP